MNPLEKYKRDNAYVLDQLMQHFEKEDPGLYSTVDHLLVDILDDNLLVWVEKHGYDPCLEPH